MTWRTGPRGKGSYMGFKGRRRKRLQCCRRILTGWTFQKTHRLENIEVMRAHLKKLNQAAANASALQPRPIHVYLLRYPDKRRILKAATNTLKDNPFYDSQIFISDDVSKSVWSGRAKRRRDHLKQLRKGRSSVCVHPKVSSRADIVWRNQFWRSQIF